MEPLKKAQVEGFLMFAEPELLFGNLDELCSVSVTSLVHMYVHTTNFIHTMYVTRKMHGKLLLCSLLKTIDTSSNFNY